MHYCYVAHGEWLLKFGVTSTPRLRQGRLRAEFRQRGDEMTNIRFFPPIDNGFTIEWGLKHWAQREGILFAGNEWLKGVEPAVVVRQLRTRLEETRQGRAEAAAFRARYAAYVAARSAHA